MTRWWEKRNARPPVPPDADWALLCDAAALARVSRKSVRGRDLEVRPVDHPNGRVNAVWYLRGLAVSAVRAEMALKRSPHERAFLARAIMG